MAQIKFLRSTVAGAKPATMVAGQIAFNLVDKRLFVGNGTAEITNIDGTLNSTVAAGFGYNIYDLSNTTAVASSNAYTDAQIAALVDSAPGLLNTLNELAAALGDDPNFATTVSNNIAANNTAIANEVTRAQAAEAALQANIDAEAAARVAEDASLNAAISAEISDREAQGVSLTAAINGEVVRAQAAETQLSADIATEATARQTADATLTSNLNAEVTRATNAETALNTRVTALETLIDLGTFS
jgi:hypothetical protein